jgi:photosystem II stability/assembly factor-like uncharacterized protein
MSKTGNLKIAQLFFLLLLISITFLFSFFFFTGCGSSSGAGGSSGSGSTGSGVSGAGKISIDVPFPARNSRGSARITGNLKNGKALATMRDVPSSVQFYGIWIFDMGTTIDAVPPVRVDRPSTGTSATVVIENVPVGWKTVHIVASDGSVAIAESDTNVYVEAGANNPDITVTLSPLPTPSSSASPSPSPSLSPSPSPSPSLSPSPSPSISPSPNPTPSLSAVNPLQGAVGTIVTLTGTNLGNSGAVFIGSTMVPAAQVNWGSTTITFTVPSGIAAGLQTIYVMPTGSTATANIQFIVTSTPPPPPSGGWQAQTSGFPATDFMDVKFYSLTEGFAVGSSGVIVATGDGGAHWVPSYLLPTGETIFAVSTPGAGVAYAVYGNDSAFPYTYGILKYTGGAWSVQAHGVGTTLQDCSLYAIDHGYAAGYQDATTDIYGTGDGLNWLNIPVGDTGMEWEGIFATATGDAVLAGHSGPSFGYLKQLVNTSGVWTPVFDPLSGGPPYYDVCVRSNRAWVVGDIYSTTSAAAILYNPDISAAGSQAFWVRRDTGSPGAALYAVHFTDTLNGWAVGSGGKIIHTTTGGMSSSTAGWTAQTSPTSQILKGVFFYDNQNGWAVGTGGTILHTTTGGN